MADGHSDVMDKSLSCKMCGAKFTVDDFFQNEELQPIGMQADEEDTEFSLFFFNHMTKNCGTTMAIPVTVFESRVEEPISKTRNAGSATCELHCTSIEDLSDCQQDCCNAPYRRLLLEMLR